MGGMKRLKLSLMVPTANRPACQDVRTSSIRKKSAKRRLDFSTTHTRKPASQFKHAMKQDSRPPRKGVTRRKRDVVTPALPAAIQRCQRPERPSATEASRRKSDTSSKGL